MMMLVTMMMRRRSWNRGLGVGGSELVSTDQVFVSFFNDSHFTFVYGYWCIGASFDDLETLTLAVGRRSNNIASCVAFCIVVARVSPIFILFLFIL